MYEEDKRVLVITVPSRPIGRLLRFEGVPLMRTGESLREMSDTEIFKVLSEQEPDFSAKICEGFTIEDLDKEAIAEMKTNMPGNRKIRCSATIPTNRSCRIWTCSKTAS